jgi:hypothetical protein
MFNNKKVEMNETENRKSVQKINQRKSWFFEKINKIYKSPVRLTKKKREKIHITNIGNERGTSLQILWILKE